jgi:hypothetical protein
VRVTDSTAAKPIVQVFVYASGLKRRPSVSSRAKIGRNETVITSNAKKTEGPTSCIARTTTRTRSSLRPDCSQSSRRLWTFSIRMIEASTIAPIATAMPPRDMMLAVMPWATIGTKASTTPIGIVRIGTSALRAWSRKPKITSETISISSISVRCSVSIEASMSCERS